MGIRAVSPSVWALAQPAKVHPNTSHRYDSHRPGNMELNIPVNKHLTRRWLSPFRVLVKRGGSAERASFGAMFGALILAKSPNRGGGAGPETPNPLICNLRVLRHAECY